MAQTLTGRCQCGAVRYTVAVDDLDAYLCHCRMCQRATGGVAAALKNVACAGLTWDGEPQRYRSSPFARRGFCAACGTPLTYEADGRERMDLTVGSFDEPGLLTPVSHAGAESMHRAWLDTSHLPAGQTQDNARIVAAWEAAGAKLPD